METERRYNTRFRGVPRSVFTYSRTNKKSSKHNDENQLRTGIKNDFVYTKLGKKSSSLDREIIPLIVKSEKKSPTESSSPPIPNGTHKSSILDKFETKTFKDEDIKIKEELTDIRDEISKICRDVKLENCNKEVTENCHKEVSCGSIVLNSCKNAKNNCSKETINDVKNEAATNNCCNEINRHESSPEVEKDVDGIFFETKASDFEESPSVSAVGSKSAWITSKEKLSWNSSPVASYNPKTKMFRCVVCQAVGFMSRIGEHYLGTHCNAKVFHCPQCSYCSAWWRCVRNHMSKNHGVSNAPASMWKNQPLLDEIMQILQNLKYSVDCEDRVERVAENSGKRYICPKCPYATDRRDLYNRHENIHREEKPFQCYVCYKLFNRADHVKKHFCRIHKEFNYDINLIRRLPSKRGRIPVSPLSGGPGPKLDINASFHDMMNKPPTVPMPPSQSHLLNYLSGSPTMVKIEREIDHIPPLIDLEPKEEKNDNTFNKSHSNLLTFLTQNALSTKTPKAPQPKNTDIPMKDILQEALLKPTGFSYLNSQGKKFLCPYCPWTGPNSWALRLHTSMHYKTFCVLCNFKSTEASDLENHMWEMHRKRSCNKCNFLADNLLSLDSHMLEAHGHKHQFSCRLCSQSFDLRSDMEAHCIFIHNQVLQECKENGCDFCTTDPNILETHKKGNHNLPSTSQDTTSASRTLCLYCGCDFADPKSRALHEELFHENPLQIAAKRPLQPYQCAVCGYSTPKQTMMCEHMRVHTNEILKCEADEDCCFDTPYESVLREHVKLTHMEHDGIARCPHCGLPCSARLSFVKHYKEKHHVYCCTLCEEVEHKHFVLPHSVSLMETSITTFFPFAKNIFTNPINSSADKSTDDIGRRSRKQVKPRKVLQDAPKDTTKGLSRKKVKHSSSKSRNNFLSLYSEKIKKIAQGSLFKCRFCVKSKIFFRHKRNYLLHRSWHYLRKHQCNKCIQTFRHHYQVLLHQREHMDKQCISS